MPTLLNPSAKRVSKAMSLVLCIDICTGAAVQVVQAARDEDMGQGRPVGIITLEVSCSRECDLYWQHHCARIPGRPLSDGDGILFCAAQDIMEELLQREIVDEVLPCCRHPDFLQLFCLIAVAAPKSCTVPPRVSTSVDLTAV